MGVILLVGRPEKHPRFSVSWGNPLEEECA